MWVAAHVASVDIASGMGSVGRTTGDARRRDGSRVRIRIKGIRKGGQSMVCHGGHADGIPAVCLALALGSRRGGGRCLGLCGLTLGIWESGHKEWRQLYLHRNVGEGIHGTASRISVDRGRCVVLQQ